MTKPQFFDIHSHMNFVAFDEDREEVLDNTLKKDTWIINVGTQRDTSAKAIEIAESFDQGVYATVGLHPIHTDKSYHDTKEFGPLVENQAEAGEENKSFTARGEEFDFDYYKDLAQSKKVVAIGECGLDYYRIKNNESRIKQKEAFRRQIDLALEIDKPLMIHCRDAYKEVLEILNSYFKIHNSKLRGNVHFFAGTWEEAKLFLNFGFTISFTGVITFTNDYDEVVKNAPLDMILSETDSPYVTPVPYRGKRNESIYVKEVVKKIALIRGEDYSMVKDALVENAIRVFELK